jgi:hypothetical protein
MPRNLLRESHNSFTKLCRALFKLEGRLRTIAV